MRATFLEKTLWTLGTVLLGWYVATQLLIDSTSESALRSFAEARRARAALSSGLQQQSHPLSVDARNHRQPASFGTSQHQESITEKTALESARGDVPHKPGVLMFEQPDTTLWSARRIAAHLAAARAPVSHGSLPLAVLRIDVLDLEVPIYEGVTQWNLNRGAAWIEGTAGFEVLGNVGVAAHRDGYFRALRKVRTGDRIEVLTLDRRLRYRVTDIEIVDPSAVEVLAPTAEATLTLVTCYPFHYVGAAPQRFIVRAERNDEPLS